jgi:ArsR family transcriptional regulator
LRCAFDGLFELQVFEGVQRVVVDEDADGALRRQQVSQPIDQAGGLPNWLRTPGGCDASRTLDSIAILQYYSLPMSGHRSRRATEPQAAGELQTFKARFFRALAHPIRISMLEILVRGGRTVQELQEALALEQPIVSQQLAVLRNQGIVSRRKEGLAVRYTVNDPLVGELLGLARRIFNNHLDSSRGLLRELRRERRRG